MKIDQTFKKSFETGLTYGAMNSGATLAYNLLRGRATPINLAQAGLSGFLFGSTFTVNDDSRWEKSLLPFAKYLHKDLHLPLSLARMLYGTVFFAPNFFFATCATYASGLALSSLAISFKAAACYGIFDHACTVLINIVPPKSES